MHAPKKTLIFCEAYLAGLVLTLGIQYVYT